MPRRFPLMKMLHWTLENVDEIYSADRDGEGPGRTGRVGEDTVDGEGETFMFGGREGGGRDKQFF